MLAFPVARPKGGGSRDEVKRQAGGRPPRELFQRPAFGQGAGPSRPRRGCRNAQRESRNQNIDMNESILARDSLQRATDLFPAAQRVRPRLKQYERKPNGSLIISKKHQSQRMH